VHLQESTEFDMDAWQRVIDVNLKSVVLCCKHAGKRMLAAGHGKIVNISSVRGFQGRAQDLAYAPSKGAINQLTRSLAIEWGPRGINVNAIAPVFTLTAINRTLLADPAKLEWVMCRIPMKRLGNLEEPVRAGGLPGIGGIKLRQRARAACGRRLAGRVASVGTGVCSALENTGLWLPMSLATPGRII
jgi:NAD(P)-dependent dehydrogenase (short-subunit alcohol dehydrogenase family)